MAVPGRRLRRAGRLMACVGLLLLAAFAASCGQEQPVPAQRGPGLFSWYSDVLEGEEPEKLAGRMDACGLTELYQALSPDARPETIAAFSETLAEHGIGLYLLEGDPSWGLDPKGERLTGAVERAAGLPGVRGVVLDVEPYLTEAWERDRAGTLRGYVDGMCRAKAAADRAGLQVIACIPYFYDKDGTEELERLIAEGCHILAVMNYDREKEVSNLETEAGLAAAYGRPLVTIYELQKPGVHGLTERNTYSGLGLDAVRASWTELRAAYPDQPFSYALHDYRSLKEVLRLA